MPQSICYPFTIFAQQPSSQVVGAAPVIITLHKTVGGFESSAVVPCSGLTRKVVDVFGTDPQNGILLDISSYTAAAEGPEWFTFSLAIVGDGPVPVMIPSASVVGVGPAPQIMMEPECTYIRIRARNGVTLPRTLKARLRGYWDGEGNWEARLAPPPFGYGTNKYCV